MAMERLSENRFHMEPLNKDDLNLFLDILKKLVHPNYNGILMLTCTFNDGGIRGVKRNVEDQIK